jgi:PDZ domain-containing protein
MSDPSSRGARMSRESRLLLVTVVVCAVVLLLMARLRFPQPASVPEPAEVPAPLERLAARASYDALAADVQRVEPMIAPNLIVLRIIARPLSRPQHLRDALTSGSTPAAVRHIAALRVSEDIAIATVDSGERVDGIVGQTGGGTASILAVDPVRRIARIRVPQEAVRQLAQIPLSTLPTPLYVVVVEGTQAGVTLRPVFLGRSDRFGSPRWGRPLLPLGGIAVSPGALLFSLSGDFIGTVVMDNGAPAIAGARDVIETGERLATNAPPVLADPGFGVQPLTAVLKAALGVERGVVVTDVEAGGSADGQLEAADVVTGIDDWSADDPDELLLRLASRGVGESVTIALIRNREPRTVKMLLQAASPPTPVGGSVSLITERGIGTRVTAVSGFADVDLMAGDVITRTGSDLAPTPAQVRRFLAQPSSSGLAIVIVRRDGRQRVVAIPAGIRIDGR